MLHSLRCSPCQTSCVGQCQALYTHVSRHPKDASKPIANGDTCLNRSRIQEQLSSQRHALEKGDQVAWYLLWTCLRYDAGLQY